jgi:hypothetical protein
MLRKINVKLFILCATSNDFREARHTFPFTWAEPLLIPKQKNQELLWMENSAWKLLSEKNINSKYIGTLSHSSNHKINIHYLNAFLQGFNEDRDFVHFFSFPQKAVNHGESKHPGFKTAWMDLCVRVKGSDQELQNLACNFWMCKSQFFPSFVHWMTEEVMPLCPTIPSMFLRASYTAGKQLSKEDLVEKWGQPYYPLAPFILERFSYQFFKNKNCLLLDFSHVTLARKKREKSYIIIAASLLAILLVAILFNLNI